MSIWTTGKPFGNRVVGIRVKQFVNINVRTWLADKSEYFCRIVTLQSLSLYVGWYKLTGKTFQRKEGNRLKKAKELNLKWKLLALCSSPQTKVKGLDFLPLYAEIMSIGHIPSDFGLNIVHVFMDSCVISDFPSLQNVQLAVKAIWTMKHAHGDRAFLHKGLFSHSSLESCWRAIFKGVHLRKTNGVVASNNQRTCKTLPINNKYSQRVSCDEIISYS